MTEEFGIIIGLLIGLVIIGLSKIYQLCLINKALKTMESADKSSKENK